MDRQDRETRRAENQVWNGWGDYARKPELLTFDRAGDAELYGNTVLGLACRYYDFDRFRPLLNEFHRSAQEALYTDIFFLVLEGAVRLEKEDYWGNRTILASFGPGQSFAEVYACEPGLPLDLNVVAAEDALVLLMDVRRVTSLCPASCAFHARLVRNLLGIVARRAHALTRKIEHTSQRTTRAKLLSYLSDQAKAAEASRFAIPFDRQELADYLSVDRSAMCAELSRMRKEGIIDFHKNVFELGEGSTL